jgi:hypothetical protein
MVKRVGIGHGQMVRRSFSPLPNRTAILQEVKSRLAKAATQQRHAAEAHPAISLSSTSTAPLMPGVVLLV